MSGPPGWYPGRCKDCAKAAPKSGAARCKACAKAHAAREAARRAERKAARLCGVCGAPAVRVAGVYRSTCETHREYFRARDEARREEG